MLKEIILSGLLTVGNCEHSVYFNFPCELNNLDTYWKIREQLFRSVWEEELDYCVIDSEYPSLNLKRYDELPTLPEEKEKPVFHYDSFAVLPKETKITTENKFRKPFKK